MKKGLLLVLACLVLGLYSCKSNYKCYAPSLRYVFNGFDSVELHIVLIKRYPKGSGFKQASYTAVASSGQTNAARKDTLSIDNLYLNNDFDEEVIVPAASGRSFRVSGLSLGEEKYKSDGIGSEVDIDCTQSWSLSLDGQTISHAEGSAFHTPAVYYLTLTK